MSPNAAEKAARVTTCLICGVDTHSFHLNYGAPSCLSCRAFFRRVVQRKGKRGAPQCAVGGGGCAVTRETRRKCKRCRYEACLRAGMRTEAVMGREEFQRHFKKMIRKRKQASTNKSEADEFKKAPKPPEDHVEVPELKSEPNGERSLEPVAFPKEDELKYVAPIDYSYNHDYLKSSQILYFTKLMPVPMRISTEQMSTKNQDFQKDHIWNSNIASLNKTKDLETKMLGPSQYTEDKILDKTESFNVSNRPLPAIDILNKTSTKTLDPAFASQRSGDKILDMTTRATDIKPSNQSLQAIYLKQSVWGNAFPTEQSGDNEVALSQD